MADEYSETRSQIAVLVDGEQHIGSYRIVNGSVIVYFGEDLKFATFDMNDPATVARWLLTDMVRRHVATARSTSAREASRLPQRRPPH